MLIQSYEELIADPARGVAEIAGHLGIELRRGRGRAIADRPLARGEPEADRRARRRSRRGGRARLEGSGQLRPPDRSCTGITSATAGSGLAGAGHGRAAGDPARICGPWLVEHGYEADDPGPAPPGVGEPARRDDDPPGSLTPRTREDILLDRLFRGQEGDIPRHRGQPPDPQQQHLLLLSPGLAGVNVEPVPSARDLFESDGPATSTSRSPSPTSEGELPFYEVADCNGLSSLSPETAEEQRAEGFQVVEHRVADADRRRPGRASTGWRRPRSSRSTSRGARSTSSGASRSPPGGRRCSSSRPPGP